MPLIKSASKAARQTNIRREIDAGKDPRQAVAIGYSVQREARKAKRRGSISERAAKRRGL